MANRPALTSLSSAIGATFAVGLVSNPALAEDPFALSELSKGYMVAQNATKEQPKSNIPAKNLEQQGKSGEGKCGEGKCGAGMNMSSMDKAPEGMCGAMDMKGMVMNENTDRLPPGCTAISEEVQITVKAGRKYAKRYNGTTYGFDKHEWRVKPCSKVTVTFVNDDKVRHQWMVHGLPTYIYAQGMFHMEVTGPGEKKGTFIAPAGDKTYLAHCDIAQHMEKGMKGQLVVGKGSADLPSIPGISGALNPDKYF